MLDCKNVFNIVKNVMKKGNNMRDQELVEELMEKLYEICEELNWTVSFNNTSDTVRGMIIGTENFVDTVFNQQEDYAEYVVLGTEEKPNRLH